MSVRLFVVVSGCALVAGVLLAGRGPLLSIPGVGLAFLAGVISPWLRNRVVPVPLQRDDFPARGQPWEESDALFRILFEHSPDGFLLLDPHDPDIPSPIVACNESAARMNGYAREELIGQPISILTGEPETHADVAEYVDQLRQEAMISAEAVHYRKDGSAFPMEFSTAIITLGGRELILGIDRDITERKRLEESLAHQAVHDPLTDLPNRTLFRNRLEQAIIDSHRKGSSVALLLMDLNRFKEVNDTFGHHVGDALLVELARRVRLRVRESDTVARIGGDEFAVLMPATNHAGASLVTRKIIEALGAPFEVDERRFELGASIGCALYPEHGTDAAVLLRHADAAMYTAKRTHVSCAVYGAEHAEASGDRPAGFPSPRSASSSTPIHNRGLAPR
jgi:diguanylate cyclase (GGDEF)-like protein/PAS domain S-box-containing protein